MFAHGVQMTLQSTAREPAISIQPSNLYDSTLRQHQGVVCTEKLHKEHLQIGPPMYLVVEVKMGRVVTYYERKLCSTLREIPILRLITFTKEVPVL